MSSVKELINEKSDKSLFYIGPYQTVDQALRLLADNEIGALLVINVEGELVGLFTERDYARKIKLLDRSSRNTLIYEVMEKQIIYVTPDDHVESCMALMTKKRVRYLPVMEQENLIGILSIGDIVKSMMADREHFIDQLLHYITGSQVTQFWEENFNVDTAEERCLS